MKISERVMAAIARTYRTRLNDKVMGIIIYEYQKGTSLTKLIRYMQCYLDIVVSTK